MHPRRPAEGAATDRGELAILGGNRRPPTSLPLSDGVHGQWQRILDAIRQTGGWATHSSDKTMLALGRMIRQREGLSVLPASTAGLNALLERHVQQTFPGDRYVAVLTGRKE